MAGIFRRPKAPPPDPMAEGVTAGQRGRETGSAMGQPLQTTLGRNPRTG